MKKRNRFTEIIPELRKESKMTQNQLAEKLGVSRSVVANWEAGIRTPSSKYVEDMAQIFGVSANHIFGTDMDKYKIIKSNGVKFDLTMLNSAGLGLLKEFYNLLINSDKYREDDVY